MFLSKLIPVPDAKKIIMKSMKTTNVELINLDEGYRRVSAQDVISVLNSPNFDRSAMDGFAIRAEDTFGHSQTNPVKLTIVDRIGAGELSTLELQKNESIKIATGAPIPLGSNSVVMEEYTQETNDLLLVEMSVTPGENVSPMGEDFKKDDVVLKTGKFLRPQELAIIASAGYDQITVYKKPKVAVITTGSELVRPKNELKRAEVINSNHYTVKSQVESSLAIPEMFHCTDNAKMIEELFINVLKDYDAIITTGGTAISKGDVVVDVASRLGEVLIHGVSMRPGKPFAFAQINKKPVFMLSGFPVAAMVQYDIFVRDALLKMQGLEKKSLIIEKKAAKKIPSTLGRTDYIRARMDGLQVWPLKIKGSGIIRSMVESDSYIIIPENLEGIAAGEKCEVLPYAT
ncbi:MAG: molybdopterin molybdotransferase MoeA [Methanobacteriaceae archaeon]